MDKNSLIGLFLIGLVIIGYTWFQAPTQAELDRQAALADSTAQAQVVQERAAQDYSLGVRRLGGRVVLGSGTPRE